MTLIERVKMSEKSEKGKIELAHLNCKIGTAKGKVTRVINKLRMSVPAFIELTNDGKEKELDRAALEVQIQWLSLIHI